MKFAQSIVLNAVPEWLDEYVDYDRLKKIVYQTEQNQVNQINAESRQQEEEGKNEQFLNELDLQLNKVAKFFTSKFQEFVADARELDTEFATSAIGGETSSVSPLTRANTISGYDNRGVHIERSLRQHAHAQPPARIMQTIGFQFGRRRGSHISLHQPDSVAEFNLYYNFRVRCAATYIAFKELKSYIMINKTAFDKILKKWDKVTGSHLRQSYFEKIVKDVEAFSPENLATIDNTLEHVLDMYAAVFTMGNKHYALVELKMHLHDHVVFDRSTVWKDLVGKERQRTDAHVSMPSQGFTIGRFFISRKTLINIFGFLVSLILYIILMCFDTMGQKEASKCLALLIFSALMWAFECIPLFATAFLVPLLAIPMHVCRDENGQVLAASVAAKLVFQAMFNDTIMVLLGGFAIAAALSKHGVAKAFASTILSKAGSRPRYVILVNMYLATFLCMWISNVATPVLCFSLVQPILRTLRPKSTVAPCLIMGIALASCIGGLSSPISSPQNIIAINLMSPSPGWGIWFSAAIPCGVINVATTWLLLLLYFRPDRDTPHLNVIKSQGFSRPTYQQTWVCIVCLGTIALWCAESALNSFWGNNGVIAAIPFVLLFATNMLNKTDLNNFLWSVVTLAQGGMALGYAVESSGLLDIIGHRIASGVNELGDLAIIFVFGMLVLVFATFVSHTVAALIILPIVKEVGEKLPIPHPNLLVMVTGLVCSVAMGLPVSGFPNMNAIMLEDPTGIPYLKIKDFLLCGIPASLLAAVLTICLGYGIVSQVGY
ncbi:SPX domain-containing protein [Mucor mucedo]|uniref:SPX domain-containing protein n=1 Tax=Mucor mucedo TaxID=29922 RepID=UPI00221EB98C